MTTSSTFSIKFSDQFSNTIRNTRRQTRFYGSSLPSIVFDTSTDVILIFIMGQSNAKGRANEEATPFTATNVFCLPLDGDSFIPFDNTNRLYSYSLGSTTDTRYSPSYAIAKGWQDRINDGESLPDLYIVGVAKGGQGLDPSVSASTRAWSSKGLLPGKSVDAFKISLRTLHTLGKSVYFAGTFWLQGERDSNDDVSASNYGANFSALYQLWKDTIGTDHFIWFTKLTNNATTENTIKINNAFTDFADYAQSRAGAYVFDASQSGISPFTTPDNIHYNEAALNWMGDIIINQIINSTTRETRRVSIPMVEDPPSPEVLLTITASEYPISVPLQISGLEGAGINNWSHNIAVNGNDQKYIEISNALVNSYSFLKPTLPSDMIDGQIEISLPAGAPSGLGAAFRVQNYSPGFRETNFSFIATVVTSAGELYLVHVPALGGTVMVIAALGSVITWPASAFRVRFRMTGSIDTTGGFLFVTEVSTDNFATIDDSHTSNQTDPDDFIPPSGRDNYETGSLGLVFGIQSTPSETDDLELYQIINTIIK